MGDGRRLFSGSYIPCLFFNRRLSILCWSITLPRIGPRGVLLLVVAILLTMRSTPTGAMVSVKSLSQYPSISACFSGSTTLSIAKRRTAQFSSMSSSLLTMLRATPKETNDGEILHGQIVQPMVDGSFAARNYEPDESQFRGPRRHDSPSSDRNTSLYVRPIRLVERHDTTLETFSATLGIPRFNNSFLKSAAGGDGVTKTVNVLESQLEEVQRKVYERNGGVEFNINSHAKLSCVLFGPQGGSTEKAVLEAKAASGDRMADLVLQYRSLKQQISRLKRREVNVRNGSVASSPSAVARTNMNEDHGADPLMLIDASSYIFRAYYSMPPIHRAIDGMPTGAVLGFCNTLNKLALNKVISGDTPRLVLVFDAKGKTFRHELYNDYKSHRPEAPVDLIPQFALVRQAAMAYGLCQIEAPSFEADDVIATLARMAVEEGLDVNIFSSDKDLMQLVSDRGVSPSVQMIDPATMKRYTHEAVVVKWGVSPSQLGDLLALAGDSADNIPGVPGIGPKTAAQLLNDFGTLDMLLQNTQKIRQNARRSKLEEYSDQARLSRRLVRLCDDIPLDRMTFPTGVERVSDLRMGSLDEDRLFRFYDEMGFQEIRRRVEGRLLRVSHSRKRASAPGSHRRPKATVPDPDDVQSVPF